MQQSAKFESLQCLENVFYFSSNFKVHIFITEIGGKYENILKILYDSANFINLEIFRQRNI